MTTVSRLLLALVSSAIGIAVMVVFATAVFYITIFVVSTGASLAGYSPSSDFVVLSSALIVVAVILTGGLTPRFSQAIALEEAETEVDRTYG